IVATVFIQCGSGYRTSGPEEMRCIGESEFVRAIAEDADRRGTKTKICAGIVSFADLRLPNADAVLEGQIAAAGGRFRGIRQIAAYDPAIVGASSYVPPPDLMNDPNFRRGLKRLPAHDLTFEAWIYHPQIKSLTEVAREAPEVKIVLNHFGGPLGVGPYKRSDVFPGWRADIRELASCPNVYVKLGGLAMIVNAFDFHLGRLPPSSFTASASDGAIGQRHTVRDVIPGSPEGRDPESMNTGLWNMDSGLAAPPGARVRAPVGWRIFDAPGAPE